MNRLTRMGQHFRKWATRRNITAYRVYDCDLPNYPFIAEIYNDFLSLSEKINLNIATRKDYPVWREEVIAIFSQVLGIKPEHTFVRVREKQSGQRQYEKIDSKEVTTIVQENNFRFEVNLSDRLDTGLFLDHRLTRALVSDAAVGKHFLNLFCYTGAFTVYAAKKGAHCISVDTSDVYLNWLNRNLKLNQIDVQKNQNVEDDARSFLKNYSGEKFDVIFCDPPVFSRGKKLERDFDVVRDYPELIEDCLKCLNSNGILFFSTNFKKFSFRLEREDLIVKDISLQTIPDDFRNKRIHHCYRIMKKNE